MRSVLGILIFMALTQRASAQTQAPLVQNLNFSAALDAVAPIDFEDSSNNQLQIRSAEFMLYGALDPYFDALINFAAHNEEGEYKAELHEGYIGSTKLLPGFRFKAGTFFLGVGRLNQFHQHDWPFISAPRVQSEFFADEGIHDTGLEMSYLLPTDSYWDITVGVTNGYQWGEDSVRAKPQAPVLYIHPVTFIDLGADKGLQLGLNYLTRTDAQGLKTQLSGLDFVFKQKEGRFNRWFLQSEIWYQNQNSSVTDRSEKIGAYIYPEYGISQNWAVGLRFDGFSDLSQTFEGSTDKQKNLDYAFAPTLTYKTSEFAIWRMAYTHEVKNVSQEADKIDRKIEFQFIAILGAHPAHTF
ncbi:outer membrane beta-barrel protein [Bdellovibrio svalbardensis]|uniref:Porin n=1 Tax=Bdellovibrio svalbardensis TaxID=2972972 RepID=A0ABT6DF17_9BACT|nr:outer membrane beta-barrel protein [Bdellovibrio svalbardensis]MDG0815383.1 porin [Bdellovibrio svalbardensis]